MMSFSGITVLVTGASSGIGKEFAVQLAEKGANLILISRSQEELNALAQSLRAKHAIRADVFPADLSSETGAFKLFEAIQTASLHVDLLVNNAGFGYRGTFDHAEVELSRAMVTLNVQAVVLLTRLFLPSMLERRRGGIINVASTAAFQPLPFLSLYAATKAFVLNFTEALWAEYRKRGVRLFCLCPGNTRTQFHQRADVKPKQIFLSAEPADVVRYGLKVFTETDRPYAVYGFLNRCLAQAYRFSPTRLTLAVGKRLYKTP